MDTLALHSALLVLPSCWHPIPPCREPAAAGLVPSHALKGTPLAPYGSGNLPFGDHARTAPCTLLLPAPTPPSDGGSPTSRIATRPATAPGDILDSPGASPVVLLENPRNLFNIGAAIRVAAAAGSAGVLVTGPQDPWRPAAIVSAAGLQFALPVARIEAIPRCDRPILAIDPMGEPMPWGAMPPGAILAFGSERYGASEELLSCACRRLAIPMTPGVSSLNLATSVAVALYAQNFG